MKEGERRRHPEPPTLEQTLCTLRAHLPELRERYGVKSLAAFGSYVSGERHRGSDLDLLVEFTAPPTLFGFVELQEHLRGLLGIRVDLVMKSALRPGIGDRILAQAVPV